MEKTDGTNRFCRFCDKELNRDHFFFCGDWCEEMFKEEYRFMDDTQREAMRNKIYKAV